MREATNAVKKSNSVFDDYKKNLIKLSSQIRKPVQVVTRIRIKPSLAQQNEIFEEDVDVLSMNTPSVHSQPESKELT